MIDELPVPHINFSFVRTIVHTFICIVDCKMHLLLICIIQQNLTKE